MQRILILISFLFSSFLVSGQFDLEKSIIYGGNSTDEAKDIAINPAGTLLFFGGRSFSTDGDVPGNIAGSDYWIMKRNLDGTLVWSKTFGGLSNDDLVTVMPHSDGGVIAFGTTHTDQGQFGTINGLAGGWLMRTNSNGSLINGKIFGGQITETAIDAFRAVNGDITMLIQAGSTTLNGQINHGVLDVWVVKVNANFDILWSNLLGGSSSDVPTAITQDINGNIYITAQTNSNISGVDPNHGGFDVWVMKLGPDGQILWQKTFGGSEDDIPNDIILHPDGFVYVTLQSNSEDDDFDENSGINDLWLLKLNEVDGNLLTKKRFGGSGNDFNGHLELYSTNHLVISTSTTSANGDLTGNKGLSDVWIIQTDLDGNLEQQMNYGGTVNDVAADILTIDSVFHVLNSSFSNDKNVPPNTITQQDFWYFTLNTRPDPCSDNFVCESDTTPTNILYPPDNNSLTCVSGCLAGLGPGPNFFNSPCADFNDPTAYFKVVTDTMSDLLTLSVTSFEFNKPRLAVFKTVNCTTYQQVLCATGANGSVIMSYLEVEPRTTYVIAVSDDEANLGQFDFCASSIHVEFCNRADRIYVTGTSMGSPANGPYQPGEQVQFCYELTNWAKLDCNGFQGLVPTFGPGWDSTAFDIEGQPLQIDSMIAPVETGFWEWYKLGDVHYNISNPINGFDGGQGMPAGWYFTNTGDPPPTDNPDQTTGDINNCQPTPGDKWKICFTLPVVEDCLSNLDCSVTMKTYADGEIGNASSLACVYDQPEIFNAILRCCLNPGISNIQDFSVCNGDTINFPPGTNLPPPVTYTWTADPDPFVTGATNGFQQESFFQILHHNVVIPQMVRYSIRAESEGCATQADDFTVTVYQNPTGNLSLVGPNNICSGATVTLHFQLNGAPPFAIGLYQDNQFFANVLAETNEITINVDPVFSSVFTIGTYRDSHCDGNGTGSVVVTVNPSVNFLLDTAICVGESLVVADTILQDPGIYSIVLENQSSTGCDSIINVNLSVIPSLTENQNYVICQGDTVFILGVPYTETTNEIIEYVGPEGCPSYIHLDLVVKDTFTTDIFQTICFGDTLEFEGVQVFEEGTYSHTEEIKPGCFEQTILHLDVLPAIIVNDLSIMGNTGNNTGAIIVEIVGGTPPFTYKWSTGQTTESIFNIPHGHYTLTVTDANGCQEVFDFEVPFVSGTQDISKTVSLTCRPTLLSSDDKLRLINSGKESVHVGTLEFTAVTGQQILLHQDIDIPGESYFYQELPAALSPGLYILTARLENGRMAQWKIVLE